MGEAMLHLCDVGEVFFLSLSYPPREIRAAALSPNVANILYVIDSVGMVAILTVFTHACSTVLFCCGGSSVVLKLKMRVCEQPCQNHL